MALSELAIINDMWPSMEKLYIRMIPGTDDSRDSGLLQMYPVYGLI